MGFVDIVVTSLLGMWLAASVLYQFRFGWMLRLTRFDVVHILPKWTFFAPNPGCTDYHLLYRDSVDDILTEWIELPLVQERSVLAALWNPRKRVCKCLLDLTQVLVTSYSASPEQEKAIVLSLPYLLILNYVSSLESSTRSKARQFMILQSHGFFPANEPDLLVRSSLHDLSPRR